MRRTIDGFMTQAPPRPLPASTPRAPRSAPIPPSQPLRRAYAAPSRSQPKTRRHGTSVLYGLAIVGTALVAGMLGNTAVLAQLAVAAYGLVAVILKIPSRLTFLFALGGMVTTAGALIMAGDVVLAQNGASCTFLLLVAGVISLGRETKQEGGRIYSIRTRN